MLNNHGDRKSPKDRVVPLPNGHPWLINRGVILATYVCPGMILQERKTKIRVACQIFILSCWSQKERIVFQASIFRCEKLVSGRVIEIDDKSCLLNIWQIPCVCLRCISYVLFCLARKSAWILLTGSCHRFRLIDGVWIPNLLLTNTKDDFRCEFYIYIYYTGWWFQPIWEILVKMGSSSPNRGENKQYLKPPASISKKHSFHFTI